MTKAIFATLALTATVVVAGPAFVEKFKAALDGKPCGGTLTVNLPAA